MTLSPCNTTPAQNKLSRHHHDMAWHHMTWKRHSARHGMTWHGITLLDINTDMTWHLMTWHPSALTIPRQHKTSCGIIMTWHDMTWNHIAWYHYLTWPMMTWQDKARHYSYGIFHTHFRVIQSELTCIIAACGLSQHPALDEDRSRHQTSNLR